MSFNVFYWVLLGFYRGWTRTIAGECADVAKLAGSLNPVRIGSLPSDHPPSPSPPPSTPPSGHLCSFFRQGGQIWVKKKIRSLSSYFLFLIALTKKCLGSFSPYLTEFYRVLLGFTEFYWVSPSLTKGYLVLLGCRRRPGALN